MGLKDEAALRLQVQQLVQQVSDSQATIASLSLQVGELLQELRAAKGLSSSAGVNTPVNVTLKAGVVKSRIAKLNSTTPASSKLAPSATEKKVTNVRSASKVTPAVAQVASLEKSTRVGAQVELNNSNGICA